MQYSCGYERSLHFIRVMELEIAIWKAVWKELSNKEVSSFDLRKFQNELKFSLVEHLFLNLHNLFRIPWPWRPTRLHVVWVAKFGLSISKAWTLSRCWYTPSWWLVFQPGETYLSFSFLHKKIPSDQRIFSSSSSQDFLRKCAFLGLQIHQWLSIRGSWLKPCEPVNSIFQEFQSRIYPRTISTSPYFSMMNCGDS